MLELECGEDIDTVRRELQAGTLEENRLLEQVKRRKSNLTLRSAAALESIANFCEHRHTNPGTRLQFRFVTTAHEGRENDWEGDANGIATWEAIRSGELSEEARAFSLERIRVLLRKAVKPDRIGERAWGYLQESLSPDERLNELIDEFEWGIESEDYPAIEHRVKHGLIQSRLAPNEEIAGEVLDRLFVSVFRTLSLAGPKRLTLAHLHAEVARKTESTADRDLMSFIRSGLVRFEQRIRGVEDRVSELEEASASAQAIISSLGAKENFTAVVDFTRPAVLLDVPELVVPSIRRTNAVQTILSSYSRGSTVSIVGEPGSGKTQLALLVAQQLGSSLVWVDIPRNATSQHACDAIDATLQSVAGLPPGPVMKPWYESVSRIVGNRLLVLDNVPRTMQGDQLTRRIEFLSSMLSARGGKLLTTSYYQLPRRTVESLSVAEIQAPRFSEEEVAELLVAYGSTGQLASQLTTLISTATQGLPILVAAVGRYLASRDWKFDVVQFDSIVKAEFARAARTDARELVQLTIPDGDTRELLYRLTPRHWWHFSYASREGCSNTASDSHPA